MAGRAGGPLRYSILDPTGNVTALVEDAVPEADQPAVALSVMEARSDVEQVGFVTLLPGEQGSARVRLRMAGGEFCGNASMCAAVLSLVRGGASSFGDEAAGTRGSAIQVPLEVSGAEGRVLVEVASHREAGSFLASVRMPDALGVELTELRCDGLVDVVPLVRMQGISHIVIEAGSAFFTLLERRGRAEAAVRDWCCELGCEGLGLMFVAGEGARRRCMPLVYVPGAGTVFWESSCASGSAAVGIWLARAQEAPAGLALAEPGGTLRVTCGGDGKTWLSGNVRHVGSFEL